MDSSSTRTSISIDSLEEDRKRKSSKIKNSEDNIDTILVPFYEKDVLIKVPKLSKKLKENTNKHNKKDTKLQESRSYLVNKDLQKNKKSSYLEMFRKQFSSIHLKESDNNEHDEIRSISPQVGDTSKISIGGESSNQVNEFYNTESYNEIYYDKLLNGELEQYLNESFEVDLNTDDAYNNLKSVSEVSQPRRNIRRTIEPQMQNVRLGGLGPDMENIKPRLERARSLQRYSEKVRMENRVKIYKKAYDNNDTNVKKRKASSNKKNNQDSSQNSYLMNKILQENIYKNVCNDKSKSSNIMKKREKDTQSKNNNNIDKQNEDNTKQVKNRIKTMSAKYSEVSRNTKSHDSRAKSSSKSRQTDLNPKTDEPPVHMKFLLDVGEVRPSSALKFLEEKHRLYQEKIKSFTNTQNQ